MVDRGGLSTLVTNPEVRSWAGSAAEREAAERERGRARQEQGMQTLEDRPEGSEEWTEMIGQMWEDMPWYDQWALRTALIPGVGDVVGLGADAIALAKDPSWANLGFMGLGIIPFMPAGSVIKSARKLEAQLPKYPGKSKVEKRLKSKTQTGEEVKKDTPILSGTAQRIFTNLRNDIPGFYEGGIGGAGKAERFARTLPEGLSNAYLARYLPEWRAIQREHNISIADQRATRNALRVSDRMNNIIKGETIPVSERKLAWKSIEAQKKDLGAGKQHTSKYQMMEGMIQKLKLDARHGRESLEAQKKTLEARGEKNTPEYKMIQNLKTNLEANARNAVKKAMGHLNQSRSMTKQYLGHDSGLEGLLEHINKVDHVENFKNFDVDNYWKTVEGLVPKEIGKEGVEQIFKQIRTLPSIGFNPNKNYQMNIRRVHTQGAGTLDKGTKERLYPVTMLDNVPAGRNPIGEFKGAKFKEIEKQKELWPEIDTLGKPLHRSPLDAYWPPNPLVRQRYASLADIKEALFQPKGIYPLEPKFKMGLKSSTAYTPATEDIWYVAKPQKKGYDSNEEFLKALEETGIKVLNRNAMIEGIKEGKDIPAVITGSAKTDAWELGGVNYMTAIDRRGKVVTIANDEHDLLGKYGKLPGADRYMNVSEPIFVDLTQGRRILSETQEAAANKLSDQKWEAADKAIDRYEEIPGVKVRELTDKGKYKYLLLPAGFKTHEQWARAQAVAKVKPTQKDWSRLEREIMFGPMRATKPILGEEDRKAGGSVIQRNPYDYPPKAI